MKYFKFVNEFYLLSKIDFYLKKNINGIIHEKLKFQKKKKRCHACKKNDLNVNY